MLEKAIEELNQNIIALTVAISGSSLSKGQKAPETYEPTPTIRVVKEFAKETQDAAKAGVTKPFLDFEDVREALLNVKRAKDKAAAVAIIEEFTDGSRSAEKIKESDYAAVVKACDEACI